jgi:formate dehydrogenase alpha subunit
MIHLTIDGTSVQVLLGTTLLDAIRQCGAHVPTLCHRDGLTPHGSCRLCSVRVEGHHLPLPACDTSCTEGMVVSTTAPTLADARAASVRMLLANHPVPCREEGDPRGPCELEAMASDMGILPELSAPINDSVDRSHPAIHVRLSACVQCERCIRACSDIQGHRVIAWSGRGDARKLAFSGVDALGDSACVACGQCVAECPTGALAPATPAQADMHPIDTVCPYCGVGCGITCHVSDNAICQVTSNSDTPANQGRLCVKGRFGLDFVSHPERLTTPLIRKPGVAKPCGPEGFRSAGWDEALQLVADGLIGTAREHGGQAVGGLGSAKCTNEDNYLFQKWMRGGLGSNNVDHCARLCHSSSVVALGSMLGSGAATNPNTDFALADAVFLIGTNTLANHPVIGTFIRQGQAAGHKLIVADPRRVGLAEEADLHLAHRPGTDAWLVGGIARELLDMGLINHTFITEQTEGFDAYRDGLLALDMNEVQRTTGVPLAQIRQAAKVMGEADSLLTGWGMGLTQHVAGSLNCMAVAGLNLMTGNLGRPGAGLNPLRGQSNVQGASDMGVLPNVFPGYQLVADDTVRGKFSDAWGCDLADTPGLTVVEMMQAARAGTLTAMHVMGENPALSDPDLGHVEAALNALGFLAVQDVFFSETAAFADVILPAKNVLERVGSITNTERRIQRTQAVLTAPGEARADGDILVALMAHAGSHQASGDGAETMAEIASLTPSYAGVSANRLAAGSLLWPVLNSSHPGTRILHVGGAARGKARFFPPKLVPPAESPDGEYPLLLTTGRILSHYQTGTLSRRSKVLDALVHDPWVEIHPETAQESGVSDGDLMRLISRRGSVEATAQITESAPPGVLFVPFHFAETPINRLIHDTLDPAAKIPEYKCIAIRMEPAHLNRATP